MATVDGLLLVDTDVFSFMFKGDDLGQRYRNLVSGHELALSFQTVAELLRGAYLRNWGAPRLGQVLAEIDQYRRAPCEWEMAPLFASIGAGRQRMGRPIGVGDAWIAATALWLGCPVVTHNTRDFGGIPGLLVVSEAGA